MTVIIENKTDERVLLRFNSGLTWRLAPGETLEKVEHVEVKGNTRIRRLQERHVVALRTGVAEMWSFRSGDMSAAEAIKQIENTPVDELRDFLSPDENRTTVLKAMQEKQKE